MTSWLLLSHLCMTEIKQVIKKVTWEAQERRPEGGAQLGTGGGRLHYPAFLGSLSPLLLWSPGHNFHTSSRGSREALKTMNL